MNFTLALILLIAFFQIASGFRVNNQYQNQFQSQVSVGSDKYCKYYCPEINWENEVCESCENFRG
jgi:hypothetical protein